MSLNGIKQFFLNTDLKQENVVQNIQVQGDPKKSKINYQNANNSSKKFVLTQFIRFKQILARKRSVSSRRQRLENAINNNYVVQRRINLNSEFINFENKKITFNIK